MIRDQINFSYLKKLHNNLEAILYTGKFTSLNEFDQCTQLWHPGGFQGPFFLIKSSTFQFVILNQNSTQDFIRTLKKEMHYEFAQSGGWQYFHFQDEQDKVYNIWFQDEDDFRQFKECINNYIK